MNREIQSSLDIISKMIIIAVLSFVFSVSAGKPFFGDLLESCVYATILIQPDCEYSFRNNVYDQNCIILYQDYQQLMPTVAPTIPTIPTIAVTAMSTPTVPVVTTGTVTQTTQVPNTTMSSTTVPRQDIENNETDDTILPVYVIALIAYALAIIVMIVSARLLQ